ncbi:MAG: excinuclease ABC subunit UvrA, partial [Omnitrophica WOR_2 bacterium]
MVVRGAAQHNLKHIDVAIPRNRLVVLTGVSGSGKSSLAFDTLYAEGQRRYVESLSSYVRRYLEQMDKPKVDYIGGLSPAISIEQKSVSKNPRSTVGTVTEVMDYLRVLYSRAGTQHCPQCGRPVAGRGAQQISDQLSSLPEGTRFQVMAPIERDRKGDHAALLEQARREGFSRARIDGKIIELNTALPVLKKSEKHTIEVVVDRMQIPARGNQAGNNGDGEELHAEFMSRLIDTVETALKTGKGTLLVVFESGDPVYFTEHNACPYCEISLPELSASLFSFNAPSGMCPKCNGLGVQLQVDPGLIVDHPDLSLLDGASRWYGNLRKKKNKYWLGNLDVMAQHYGVDLELPWKDLPQKFRDVILTGSGDEKFLFRFEGGDDNRSFKGESVQSFLGVMHHISRLFRQTKSDWTRRWYMSFMSQLPCPTCGGTRLCAEARYVTLGDKTFPQVMSLTIEQVYQWVLSLVNGGLHRADYPGRSGSGSTFSTGNAPKPYQTPPASLNEEQMEIVGEVLKELTNRLRFMLNVGLHYLTLDRAAPTLSGGEGQRIRLASQLGCGLVGVLYILDEPSIGLHARDQRNLLDTLMQLRDMGNTVLVVEHDAETMRTADWLIDLGPGAGVLGGEVVAAGTPDQVAANPDSLTGLYLSGKLRVTAPNGGARRQPKGWLSVEGARLFNLKNVNARFPLGVLTVVTGVSGSGKSSLVADTLFPALQRELHGAQSTPGPHDRIVGLDQVDKVINITQDPIGRTPRSNPATYVGVFDEIRKVFATTPEARMRGYKSDRFSFNVKGGRCEACHGHGWRRVEMHFLPDVWVLCQECKGARYNRHTLEVTYKGKNIADVLNMDVQEALVFFGSYPEIARSLQTLNDVGLEYVKLGQSAT